MQRALFLSAAISCLCGGDAFSVRTAGRALAGARAGAQRARQGGRAVRMEFGETFYKGFEDWCSKFAPEEREKFPEYFELPQGVYEVAIKSPMGIVFEEVEPDEPKGVRVLEVSEGSNAEAAGVQVGDLLLAVTGVKVIGAKFDRPLIQADVLDFDTILSAISSNQPKWGCNSSIMQFVRAGEPYPTEYISGEMRSLASPLEPLEIA